MRTLLLGAAALLAVAMPTTAPRAQPTEIRIAVRTDVSSIDPHYHAYIPNRAISRHIFDSLTAASPRGEVLPGLANDVLELDTGVLLPLVDACVLDVDLAAGRITVARGFAAED